MRDATTILTDGQFTIITITETWCFPPPLTTCLLLMHVPLDMIPQHNVESRKTLVFVFFFLCVLCLALIFDVVVHVSHDNAQLLETCLKSVRLVVLLDAQSACIPFWCLDVWVNIETWCWYPYRLVGHLVVNGLLEKIHVFFFVLFVPICYIGAQ